MRLRAALLVAVALGGGCSKGSALVQMEIEAEAGLTLDEVEVSVTAQRDLVAPLNRQVIPWTGAPLSVGLYLPSSAPSLVWAHARGRRAGQVVAEAEPQSVTVSAGAAAGPIPLRLMAGGPVVPGDGGAPPADGAPQAGDGPGPQPDAAAPDATAGERPPPAPDGGSPTPTWTPPRQVEMDPINREFEAVVAVDPVTADAVALFIEKEAQLVAVRYTRAGDQWSAPQVIATGARLDNAQVGMDAGGHVFALWTQAADGVMESRSSDRGATWTKAAVVRAASGAGKTSLAVGRNNRARAAWEESIANANVMFTAYFDGAAWSAAAMPLGSNDFFGTRQASIAVDGSGAGWIAWAQPEPMSPKASEHLYVSRFAGAVLEAPQILDKEGASVQPPPVLSMTSDGKSAVVVWQQNYTGAAHDYLASVWSAGGAWSAPEKAVVGGGERPDVVIDATGAVTLAYQDILPASATRNTLVVRREGGKWTAPKTLETSNTAPGGLAPMGEEPYPVARADLQGNVWVVWRKGKNATTYGLAGARFSGGTWGPEVTIASRQDLAVSWPLSLAITDYGRALVVWVYVRGSMSAMDADLYSLYAASAQ